MMFTRNINRYRLVIVSILISALTVGWAVPISSALDNFVFGDPNLSTQKGQVSWIACFLPTTSLCILLFACWISLSPIKGKLALFMEHYLFSILSCFLSLSFVVFYQEHNSETGFELSGQHFGIIGAFLIYSLQNSYRHTFQKNVNPINKVG